MAGSRSLNRGPGQEGKDIGPHGDCIDYLQAYGFHQGFFRFQSASLMRSFGWEKAVLIAVAS